MQYPGGSASESSGVSTGVGSHRNGSAGSSPDFPGGYDSAEYGESPPDTTNRGSTAGSHVQHTYSHTPPALETSYASAPMPSGMPYHASSYSSSGATRTSYSTSTGQPVNYSSGGSGGYVYAGNGGDYPSPPGRSYPSAQQWSQSNFNFGASSRPRLSDSPPLSPIDTRSPSYFPPTHRDYALSAVGSGAVPSSPTTPSSVGDSPSTPFSPHYTSAPYGGSTHGHSHSHSSSASASGYIPGTPLPPLQLNTGHAGGHFVPPTGNDYPIPASPSPYSPSHHVYGRSSPPDQPRISSAPVTNSQPVGPLAGPGFASRPFLCDDCGMNFARTHDLKRHQTTHVPGVKKTHPCPYCGKNLSRRDAIKRHVVSKQCPVANDKGYGWPPPEGHVPPPPDTHIERTSHRRGENPYPVLAVSPGGDRSGSYSSGGYGNGSPSSPGPYSPNGYSGGPGFNGVSSPGGYGDHGSNMGHGQTGVVFEYDHRSYKGR